MAMVLVMNATIVLRFPMLINVTMIVMVLVMRATSVNSVKFTQLITTLSTTEMTMMMTKDMNLPLTTMKSQRSSVQARFTSKNQRITTKKLEAATMITSQLFSRTFMENVMLLALTMMIMIRFSLVVVVIVTIVHRLTMA